MGFVVASKECIGVLMMFIMLGNAAANGRRTKKLKHCWTRRPKTNLLESFDPGIMRKGTLGGPSGQGTMVQNTGGRWIKPHKIPPIWVVFFFSIYFPLLAVVRSGRSKRFHEQNWFECLCFTALLEDAHDLYILDRGANGCIRSIHLSWKAVWNRLALRLHAKIMKDISALMKWHVSSHDLCACNMLW